MTDTPEDTGRPEEATGTDEAAALPRGGAGVLDLLWPRINRGQFIAGLLCLVLGFAVAAQVQSTKADTTFATARQDELVGILSDLSQRSDRLRADIRDLEDTRASLERDGQGGTAMEEARRRAAVYGVLAGTLPATGQGIVLDISDPARRVPSGVLLDTLQELRDAGAEVIQINDVRAGVNTYFTDLPGGGVAVDGHRLEPPYRFLVIGDPHVMSTALNIPGGVMKNISNAGGSGSITQPAKITVSAVRSP
ncbi:DUF881 domain-containing protein [Actinomadura scrupuli]|uniref:DUF881 domain-containing protein n=1 Tax=Actinomadura scrupuli TaxID=559629 RepID=UPI003D954CCB